MIKVELHLSNSGQSGYIRNKEIKSSESLPLKSRSVTIEHLIGEQSLTYSAAIRPTE
jgi:hypothetical protein